MTTRTDEEMRVEAVAVLQSISAHLAGSWHSKVDDCLVTIQEELDRQFSFEDERKAASSEHGSAA